MKRLKQLHKITITVRADRNCTSATVMAWLRRQLPRNVDCLPRMRTSDPRTLELRHISLGGKRK